ncbi:2-hydroxychromene-2-carboxylate isomerase [Pseudomonas sp. SA3-5]|uniref:2-hydroxychromene-2-carboxylate isomerase n=1 Tax=Pseudomonas aestuarii TaxID=3018340 RepID=A0ABT4X8X1_9PSED|nr:2-hydroxychromene-2-carboxylate isomerase [Pseudomonas aestuarii]MDA7084825.1 2-hydroxychromene-2-carboxylate isomerase [Pseudomonas aestuarii]
MSKQVEFFFDFGSPASYLAWSQLPRITAAAGAQITWRPMLLGGVFKASGNQSPVAIPAKGRYMLQDLARFAQRYDVPLAFNPYFPINTLQLMRGAAGYLDSAAFQPYVRAVFEAIWVQQQNLGNREVVAQVLRGAGLNPAEFKQLVSDEAVKQRLKDNTEEAIRRGVFGAPTLFVDGEMFFGQDRLDFVAEALARQA